MWLTMRSIRSAGLVGRPAGRRGRLAMFCSRRCGETASRTNGSRGMHGEQHAVEHRKADRAGVDAAATSPLTDCRWRRGRQSAGPVARGQARNTSRSYWAV